MKNFIQIFEKAKWDLLKQVVLNFTQRSTHFDDTAMIDFKYPSFDAKAPFHLFV